MGALDLHVDLKRASGESELSDFPSSHPLAGTSCKLHSFFVS